jgi:hypothetical protein
MEEDRPANVPSTLTTKITGCKEGFINCLAVREGNSYRRPPLGLICDQDNAKNHIEATASAVRLPEIDRRFICPVGSSWAEVAAYC